MLTITKTDFRSHSELFTGSSILIRSGKFQESLQSDLCCEDETEIQIIKPENINTIFENFIQHCEESDTLVLKEEAHSTNFYHDIVVLVSGNTDEARETFDVFREYLKTLKSWKTSEVLRLDELQENKTITDEDVRKPPIIEFATDAGLKILAVKKDKIKLR